jgi:hypothetical protein
VQIKNYLVFPIKVKPDQLKAASSTRQPLATLMGKPALVRNATSANA